MRKINCKLSLLLCLGFLFLCSCNNSSDLLKLENEHLTIEIAVSESNIPYIKSGVNKHTSQVFFSSLMADSLAFDFPENLRLKSTNLTEDNNFKQLEITAYNDSLQYTWVYKLLNKSNSFSSQIKIKNTGTSAIKVLEYPILTQLLPADNKFSTLKYWKSLSYKPVEYLFAGNGNTSITSSVHSSDAPNELPYWVISNKSVSVFYGLFWSGGWKTDFSSSLEGIHIRSFLNYCETQLTLSPSEEISGPEIMLTLSDEPSEILRRQTWLTDRQNWAKALYKKPNPSYPLIYNSWYAVELNLSKEFILNQLNVMEPFAFDAFVVDDGWYKSVGNWNPTQAKFPGNSLAEAYATLNDHGIISGIWSCPQLIATADTMGTGLIDEPGRYVPYMDAWLIDMAGTNFEDSLVAHIQHLKDLFHINWWKYDQDFFAQYTRQGKMRNVLAFQNALSKVRQHFPDLYIESCMSGGRMINEFTNGISQVHWPKDVDNSGLEHAWSNFCENLGALQMMQPYMNQKWINNPENLALKDTAVVRFYAQSCLPGTFGISADLYKLPPVFHKIISQEIDNYRKIEAWKTDMLYDIHYPLNDNDAGYIVFYQKNTGSVAIICARKFAHSDEVLSIEINPAFNANNGASRIEVELIKNQYSKIVYHDL